MYDSKVTCTLEPNNLYFNDQPVTSVKLEFRPDSGELFSIYINFKSDKIVHERMIEQMTKKYGPISISNNTTEIWSGVSSAIYLAKGEDSYVQYLSSEE